MRIQPPLQIIVNIVCNGKPVQLEVRCGMRVSQLIQIVRQATRTEGFDFSLVQSGKCVSNLNAAVAEAILPSQSVYVVKRARRSPVIVEDNVFDLYEQYLERVKEWKMIRDMATKASAWTWEQ